MKRPTIERNITQTMRNSSAPPNTRKARPGLTVNRLLQSGFATFLFAIVAFALVSNVSLLNQLVSRQASSLKYSGDQPQPTKYAEDATDQSDIHRIARVLTDSFSTKDGIPSMYRFGFNVTIPSLDTARYKNCTCDLVSIDCLDSIACIPHLYHLHHRNALAVIGMEIRRAIKTTSIFRGDEFAEPVLPLGKNLQYSAMNAWRSWRAMNVLPTSYSRNRASIFINETRYPACLKEDGNFTVVRYSGFSCFYQDPKNTEDSAGAVPETAARDWFHDTIQYPHHYKRKLNKFLKGFLWDHQPHFEDGENDGNIEDFKPRGDRAEYEKPLSSFGNLMMFAHITRIMFNRRPFLDKMYREKSTSVGMNGSNHNSTSNNFDKGEPFNVALHIRRGDSCPWEGPPAYKREATPLDSPAQTGGKRHCFITGVYIDAIRRIRSLVPKSRPLHVYLATDDVGDVMDEILNNKYERIDNNDTSKEIIEVDRWHFMNYSREVFQYNAPMIESDLNQANQPTLGETAVADLWHLSHGHAFVGHLGSRFGKVSWLLATARQNAFIPFFTVDGHSKYGVLFYQQRDVEIPLFIFMRYSALC